MCAFQNLISRHHIIVIGCGDFLFSSSPRFLTVFVGCSNRFDNVVFVGIRWWSGFLGDVGSGDVSGVAFAVEVFWFTFGVLNTAVVRDGYIFAVLVDSDGFQCRCNNAVGSIHLVTEIEVYDIVLLFLVGSLICRRALNEYLFALFKDGEMCDGICCVAFVFCAGLDERVVGFVDYDGQAF